MDTKTTNPESESLSAEINLATIETLPVSGLTNPQLEELVHALVAKRLIEALRTPELCTPQLLAQALRFLAQNDITGLAMPGTPTEDVKTAFAAKLPFKLKVG
jgi:hypothetical protein